MGDNNVITSSTPPSFGGRPQVRLDRGNFDAAGWQKGYEVIHEKAIRCPCKEEGADNLSSCRNCGGSGWFFINPNKTKMLMLSMNQETQFKEWSEELRGTVRITALEGDKIAFMDRITLNIAESVYSETAYPKLNGSELFFYTVYQVISVLEVYLFEGANVPLKRLIEGSDFVVDANTEKVILDPIYNSLTNPKITIRYDHHPQYHIIDLVRGTMYSEVKDLTDLSGSKTVRFPISAIGKVAHYTLTPKNYSGDYLFDNSYVQNNCKLP
jgi:hypothetical protein